jgi:acetylornithine/succinyldiaminopimelate/putrescine aminotransferase
MYLRQQFIERIAQTSEIPQGFQVRRAAACHLYDENDVAYLDLISGFGVNNIGHGNPEVIQAIQQQSKNYLHSNVYGEHIQNPQIELAELICSYLPSKLNSVYFLSSGSESIDAAIKLARLATSRNEIVACRTAYHGSTIGAESLRSDEAHKTAFRPLLPGIRFIDFNNRENINNISSKTAAVILEVVQAEAGVIVADPGYLEALRKRCDETGSLLIFDEIQTGIGRCGKFFAFQNYQVIPDLLLCGKALGAGLPLSGLICDRSLMNHFHKSTALGYISTFGGNPLCCAAGFAGLKFLMQNQIIDRVHKIAKTFIELLHHPQITEIRHSGLLMAIELKNPRQLMTLIQELYRQKILVEGFLFNSNSLRIAPPLIISESELEQSASQIINILSHLNE